MVVAAPAQLECQVQASSGEVQLRSTRAGSAGVTLHFQATTSSIPHQTLELGGAGGMAGCAGPAGIEPGSHAAAGSGARLAGLLGLRGGADAAAPPRRGIRCTAEVALSPQGRFCGWIAHPAVADNALQLGPATGDVGREDAANGTRVVAGIAAHASSEQVRWSESACGVMLAGSQAVLQVEQGSVAGTLAVLFWCCNCHSLLPHMQAPTHRTAWTSTDRAPMAADGSIYTFHRLCGSSGGPCLHIRDLHAKAIQLGGGSMEAAAAADRRRVIYETEWQAVSSHAVPHAAQTAVGCRPQQGAQYVLAQPGAVAAVFAMPRPAGSAGGVAAAGTAVATCTAHTVLLQTVAAHASRSSAMHLLTHASQPVARAPAGCHVDGAASAAALSMQSMMRVAAQEFGAVQWGSADVGLSYPPLPTR